MAIRDELTSVLRRGDVAIRVRLARTAAAAAALRAPVSAIAPRDASVPPTAPMLAAPSVAGLAAAPQDAAVPPQPEANDAVTSGLTALARISVPGREQDRTFIYALGIVVILHLVALAGTIELDGQLQRDRERQGQDGAPQSIAVELVEAPDAKTQSKDAQIGKKDAPPAPLPKEQPPPQPPPQREQKQQTPVEPVKAEPTPDKPVEKPVEKARADDGPDPVKDPAEKEAEKEVAELPKETPRDARDKVDPADAVPPSPPPQPEASERLGAAPPGKESAYGKEVIARLAKTKPQLWVGRAEIELAFLLTPAGEVKTIKILKSSKDPVFDDVVLEWIKRAKFPHPPANPKPEDLAHFVRYTIQ